MCGKMLVVACCCLLLGCRATSVLVGVDEPDLSVLKAGSSRSQVEALLGSALWYPGEVGEIRFVVYQYPEARAGSPGLGAAGLVMDYVTLGLMEWNLNELKDFDRVKQLAVGYDANGVVSQISGPWPVAEVGACRRQRKYLPAELAEKLQEAKRQEIKDPEPLSICGEVGDPLLVGIDGVFIGQNCSALRSGKHQVSIRLQGGASVEFGDLFLKSARRYVAKHKRYWSTPGRPHAGKHLELFWIEDATHAETIACQWERP